MKNDSNIYFCPWLYKYEEHWTAVERRLARKDQTVAMVRESADLPECPIAVWP